MSHNAALKEFLRSRRARLRADDILSENPKRVRRVPGLRREEVAGLAGVSVDYYTRLEQGRDMNVSDEVLDAVGRALQLDDVERAYFFQIARKNINRAKRPSAVPVQRARPGVRRLLEMLDYKIPGFVFGRRMDVLASNRLARALMIDFEGLPARDRNLLRYVFLDESSRDLFADWESVAQYSVALLRSDAGRHPHDPLLTDLVGELAVRSPEFRRWWANHTVGERNHGLMRYHHPSVGSISLSYEVAILPDDMDQTLCLYTAEAGSESETALRLLATQINQSAVLEPPGLDNGLELSAPDNPSRENSKSLPHLIQKPEAE